MTLVHFSSIVKSRKIREMMGPLKAFFFSLFFFSNSHGLDLVQSGVLKAKYNNIGCPAPSVAQRSIVDHHTRHIGGMKRRVVDDYWVK
jgi:hypothetical protein